MFKVYKWLGYYLLRPYKRFEHLLKYLAIYFAKLNKLQKNRKERLNREIRKTYLSPGARPTSPAGPAREASSVVFLPARQSSSLERRRCRGRHLNAQELTGRPRTSKCATE